MVSRSRRRACVATLILVASTAPPASAAPTVERVRIEGRATTLFEGPILTAGHAVRATSDSVARHCDATNNGAHDTPGPTPTAAADDAMRLMGSAFDAQWYPGFDDYFIQQFGPDRQDEGAYAYWGILVNGVYTSVGGCQYRLAPGDLALWVYDAFSMRNLLRLDGPSGVGEPTADAEGAAPTGTAEQVFTVGLGAPFTVTTVENEATGDVGAAGYRRPVAGITVAPVATAADGSQTVLTADPAAVSTGTDGRATLSWSTPGWKRIKADGAGYVRSNRLDVCVRDALGRDCGALPPDAQTRAPAASSVPEPAPTPAGSGSLVVPPSGGGSTPSTSGQTPVSAGPSTISDLRVTTDGNPTALISVRWRVTGEPLKGWRIDYRERGAKGRAWHGAAIGTTQTSALLDLPVGRLVDLRIHFEPSSGDTVERTIGTVAVPVDDRLRQVRFGGRFTRDRDPLAWRQTVTTMRRGATLSTTVLAGRPTLVVRSDAQRARVEVIARGGKPHRLVVPAHHDGRTVLVSARARPASGVVRVRVLSGVVRVDGIVASA